MVLPSGVAAKFDLYTLACRELLDRVDALCDATQGESRVDYETCVRRFDKTVSDNFHEFNATDRQKGADQLANDLRVRAGYIRDTNERAAAIFEEIAEGIGAKATSWDGRAELDAYHSQGRELAQRFFGELAALEIRDRLDLACHLILEYGEPDEEDRVGKLAERFGYRAAPMAYHNKWLVGDLGELEDIIVSRFTFECDFAHYLAYPFLFLHEYASHVYALCPHNELFNDGWMLRAADAFLRVLWARNPKEITLHREQAGVFHTYLFQNLGSNPRKAIVFAGSLEDCLDVYGWRERFDWLTQQLLAFQPKEGEGDSWPDLLINRLAWEFRHDRQGLMTKIREAADVRALMRSLTPI